MQHDLFDYFQNFQPPGGGEDTERETKNRDKKGNTRTRYFTSADPIHQRHNLCSATSQFQKRANIPTCLGRLRGTFRGGL